MLYKYFLPNLTYGTALYLRNADVLNCYSTLNVLFATKYLTTELAHSKLNMVYLAELLVIMTDRLKIVRTRARNVPRKRTPASLLHGIKQQI